MVIFYTKKKFYVFSLMVSVIFFIFINEMHSENKKQTLNLSKSLSNNISLIVNDIFNHAFLNTASLAKVLENKDIDNDEFVRLSKGIIERNEFIYSIAVAPNGVVDKIFPLEGNVKALGHDLMKDIARNNGAEMQKHSEFIIIGPVNLIQNNKAAFIFRIPYVDDKGEFSGFVSVTILQEYISNKITSEVSFPKGYKIELLGFDPDNDTKTLIYSNVVNGYLATINSPITVLGVKWNLILYSNENFSSLVYLYIFIYLFVLIVLYKVFEFFSLRERYLLKNSQLDALTQVGNRTAFEGYINKIYLETNDFNYFLAILDLDYFKKINDSYGHIYGDYILKEFSSLCQSNLRTQDLIFRWGGEEFVILIKNTDQDSAFLICERLKKIVESTIFKLDNGVELNLTVSIGLSRFHKGSSISENIKKSDLALYQAKNKGRNLVVVYK